VFFLLDFPPAPTARMVLQHNILLLYIYKIITPARQRGLTVFTAPGYVGGGGDYYIVIYLAVGVLLYSGRHGFDP